MSDGAVPSTPAQDAAALLGESLADTERLHGGDLSAVIRIRTGRGRTAVVKSGPHARAEARMLRAIARAGAPTPEVLGLTNGLLVLQDLGPDDGPGAAWADLGRILAQLHATIGDSYGWPEDHAFGEVPIPNDPSPDWPEFWAERRLLPSCAVCPPDLARRIERLAARLGERLPKHPRPSLLHGDLWTGNIMARGGQVTGLIDPACYFGHSEVDLAMLMLFGRPGQEFWSSHDARDPGFDARLPIYQLWPALVHLRLFGAGYRGLVERCLDAAG